MFMLFPVLLMDKTKLGKEKGGELKTTTFWSISMFLTNATLLPYFSLQERRALARIEKKTKRPRTYPTT